MQTFIRRLVTELLEKYQASPSNLCIIFPSKRAAVFFEEGLKKAGKTPIFRPQIFALEDFIREMSRVTILDSVSLTFELYPIYREKFPDEEFDEYYSWGSIMVEDFDEVDRYLVDANQLYVNLFDLKKLDTTIDSWLNEDGKPTDFQKRYLQFWDEMSGFYTQLRAQLRDQKMASEGMALRDLATKFSEEMPPMEWDKLIFAGFNALTPAEELLMESLVAAGKADWYWDMDNYFVEDSHQEAGKYFRGLKERFPEAVWNWTDDFLAETAKKVYLTAVPRRVAQAKVTGMELAEIAKELTPDERTAIVLPDEGLLFPVLHSLPESIKDINVTMGFPMKATPLFTLVESIIRLHENADRLKATRNAGAFYFRDIRNILNHPMIQQIDREAAGKILAEINKNNFIYLSASYFEKTLSAAHPIPFIFREWKNLSSTIDWFLELFSILRTSIEEAKPENAPKISLEIEFLYHFFTLTNKMKEKLDRYDLDFDLGTFRRLYREVIFNTSIPFSGEPLKGLQVMGMLETRVLDFDRIFMLSVNEGILPASPAGTSYIPYGIRKAFNMPTPEDQDALFAYHFYRLLKRCSEIHLIYNTENTSVGGGEKSRFIAQIEAELAQRNPQIELIKRTLTFPLEKQAIIPIIVEKTPEVLQQIELRSIEKGLSPSALITFINCPLEFYNRYVLGIKETDEPQESPEANTFGTIVHNSLQSLYTPYLNQTITAEILDEIREEISAVVREEFEKETHSKFLDEGKNLLLRGIMEEMIRNLIHADQDQLPFDLLGLEEDVDVEIFVPELNKKVKMMGKIDRIDHKSQFHRVIDYKTGKFETNKIKLKTSEDIIDVKNRREGFQMLAYAYMFMKKYPDQKEIKAGIYGLRDLDEGINWLKWGTSAVETVDSMTIAEFETEVQFQLNNLFDPNIPFVQTSDEDKCRYCLYKTMCGRQ